MVSYGGSSTLTSNRNSICAPSIAISSPLSNSKLFDRTIKDFSIQTRFPKLAMTQIPYPSGSVSPLNGTRSETIDTQNEIGENLGFDPHKFDAKLVQELVYDALVWSSLHGLVVGDRAVQRSGRVPGVGLVHALISLLRISFPEDKWKQACELAPVFNGLMDRVGLDAQFLQDSLSSNCSFPSPLMCFSQQPGKWTASHQDC